MHGVPADLNLAPFHGAMLERVDLGIHIIHFRFGTEQRTEISIEGHWELRDGTGRLVDQQMEPSERDCYRLHVLIGRAVVATEVSAPESFALGFDSGHVLRVYDRSEHYESFSVMPGNVYV